MISFIIMDIRDYITDYEVGKKIRNTIKELGGTMPEDLPTPNKSLKELEKENKLKLNDGINEKIVSK